MKKLLPILLVLSLSLVIGIAVSSRIGGNNGGSITVIDMEGKKVSVPKNVTRVACISPSATDLMIAFGAGDRIAGTYRSFTYNPWATEIYPPAMNYKAYDYSVSAEELLADGIELVILQNTEYADAFRNVGIPVVAVHQYSPSGFFEDEVCAAAVLLGEIFGGDVKVNADKWIEEVRSTVDEIKTAIGSGNSERTVYYVNGEKQKGLYYSDGGNSMMSYILSVANARLATEKYEVLNVHKVSDEEMIALNPHAMLIGGVYQNSLVDELNASPVWSVLECNRQNRIYRIPVAMVGIENISAETPVMLRYAASLLNPDYSVDIVAELKSNIKKYFDYELSDEGALNMCNGLAKNGERVN